MSNFDHVFHILITPKAFEGSRTKKLPGNHNGKETCPQASKESC